jgi:hypothetical protein
VDAVAFFLGIGSFSVPGVPPELRGCNCVGLVHYDAGAAGCATLRGMKSEVVFSRTALYWDPPILVSGRVPDPGWRLGSCDGGGGIHRVRVGDWLSR